MAHVIFGINLTLAIPALPLMHSHETILKASALLLLSLLLSACGGESGGREARVDEGIRLGVLHKGNGAEPQGLDPHTTSGIPENHIITALFEGLVSKNPQTLEVEPGVAESWDISEDGLSYTFHLRHDARWSNDDPLTAEDFRWSWQRAMTPALANVNSYMFFPIVNAEAFATGEISDFTQVGVEVSDPYTLQVRLRAPAPYLLQLFDHHTTYPVHRATIESFGDPSDRLTAWARPGNLVGNGPFLLTEWEVNSRLRIEKNPQYWDSAAVQLSAVVFYPTENLTTEERMFRDGQLHYTEDVPIDKVPVYLRNEPDLIEISPYLGTYFYIVNTKKAPFDDVRVRKALALSIDRQLLVETVLQGLYEPAYALVPPGTLGYQPPRVFEYDPEEAKRLLAEAGFAGGQGFPPFEILYNTHEQHQKIAVTLQQMWQQTLGIQATLLNQEWQVYLDTQKNRNYGISRRSWIGDYVDPNTFLDMYISGGGNNYTGFSNARYDEIVLHLAPRTADRQQRYTLYKEAETLLMNEMPILPIYTYRSKHLMSPCIQGMPENIMDWITWKYVYLECPAQ